MEELRLRPMERSEWPAVAELIYVSTNYWYEASRKGAIFSGGPEVAELFCQVYEDLDPGCCVVAEHPTTGRLMGSCFYHPRETHVSLGIMNVHPAYFRRGVARRLLRFVTDAADAQGKPVRLVSSAMNLDSFSLYTRAGFVPRLTYQDVLMPVPESGVPAGGLGAELASRVRPAQPEDVGAIAALELELAGISRRKDYRYFIENPRGIWHVSVLEGPDRRGVDGFLASVNHPGSNMVGPGIARDEAGAAALLRAELNEHRGRSPVFLVPVDAAHLVEQVYAWGGKNVELHVAQIRGAHQPFQGISLPTFMPETG